jgi:hypothetical protein
MVLTMPAAVLTAAVFFMSSAAAAPAFRYKNGKTAAGYEQQETDYH